MSKRILVDERKMRARKKIIRPGRVSTDDLALLEKLSALEARESFYAFRRVMRPTMLTGWWIKQVALEMQLFWNAFRAGKRPILIIEAPPQHGKSWSVSDFVSWAAGKDPDLKMIYASYSDRLGRRANLMQQKMIDNPRYYPIFPNTKLARSNAVSQVSKVQRNSDVLEFIDHEGLFFNTTVKGQITGMGLDLGIIDDPIKGREESSSKKNRDKVWDWFTDDFFTRFSEYAGLIFTMTRWHLDDPAGRLIELFPRARVLKFEAIATKDERYRRKGEALFPEQKSLRFLYERKNVMTQASWESLYQQNPIIVGGGMFPIEKFEIVEATPSEDQIQKTVRYWDKAGTSGGGAYTCGVLIHLLSSGKVMISDVVRGQWSAYDRESRIKQTAILDQERWGAVDTWLEQEPGSGGKESAERSVLNLRGFSVHIDRVTSGKEVRADPYAAQVQAGNVMLLKSKWVTEFLNEHETFPNGKYKDQVDAAAGAFMKASADLLNYDATLSWV